MSSAQNKKFFNHFYNNLVNAFLNDFYKIFLLNFIFLTGFFFPLAPLFADTIDYAIIGDAGKWNANTKSVYNSILKFKVKSLILPGDNLYDIDKGNTYEKAWSFWTKKEFDFSLVAIGNHHNGYEKEIEFFKMPGEFYVKSPHSEVLFIVLNSDNTENVEEQMKWLQKQLAESKAKFIFLVQHHPPVTLSSHHVWTEKTEYQTKLRSLIKKYRHKLTALIVGHDHSAMLASINNLPIIVSGAVQEAKEDSPISNTQEGLNVKTLWYYKPSPHWVKLKIDIENEETMAHFIQAKTGRVACSVEINTGESAILDDNCLNLKKGAVKKNEPKSKIQFTE